MYPRLRTSRQLIILLIISMIIIISLRYSFRQYIKCPSCPSLINSTPPMIFYNKSSAIDNETPIIDDSSILCLETGYHLDDEQDSPRSPIISAPSFISSRMFRFPYRYSHWQSSSLLPRLLTPCEHTLLMHLLMIIDRICRQNQIRYFISEGTLLGSLRHHDIIPWDDDVDVMMSYQQRTRFTDAFERMNQTLIKLYLLEGKTKKQNYYKLFYKDSPSAGGLNWSFPFIDIFFYKQNKTSLWSLVTPDVIYDVNDVFPLVLRPLGQLWVPTPREPRRFFSFDPFDECISHFWDHRNEIEKEEIYVKCSQLQDTYPFVEQMNKTDSIEVLKINNTTIHTVIFK